MKRELTITIFVAAAVFTIVSAVSVIALGPFSNSEVSAHDGGGEEPPWVDPVTHIVDLDLVPDRMPVSDRNGGIYGYMEIDKNPNDDPEPGDDGFALWNESKLIYDAPEGGNIVGRLWSELDSETMVFVPVNEDDSTGGGEGPGDDEEGTGPVGEVE